MNTLLRFFVSAALFAAAFWMGPAVPGTAQSAVNARPDPALYGALHWRTIGPEGNRFSATVGIPGDPHTYYVGAASGGIYKDHGRWGELVPDLRRAAGSIHRGSGHLEE